MTISNPYFLAALVVFMTAYLFLAVLRLRAQYKSLQNLKMQREERQKNEDAAKRRAKEAEARTKESIASNEARKTHSESMMLRAEDTQKLAQANQERWEKVIARLETLMDKIERQNNG